MARIIWLRHETKPFEQRSALTPMAAKKLLLLGHQVIVEESPERAFSIEEFKNVGCEIVPMNSWITKAPASAIILGLKELEDRNFPLTHRHIHFAHVYKAQAGAKETLNRFIQGGGKLYDLEYLVDMKGKRIAAFGHWAGFVGAGLGVKQWIKQQRGQSLNDIAPLSPSKNSSEFITQIRDELDKLSQRPRAIIIGARGRCGKGASELLNALGISTLKWGSKETKNKGPFKEILDFDIMINCAFMAEKTMPFLTKELLKEERNLSSISDVGCDPTGPCNPLPIYEDATTMDMPSITLDNKNLLELTAIDHLPSLLPRESSEDFCQQLLPHFIEFLNNKIENTPWGRSLEVFFTKTLEYGLEKREDSLDGEQTKLM